MDARRENKVYFLVIPCNAENLFYMFDRRIQQWINLWDKIVALKKEREEKRNQILAVGKKQIKSILKEGE